MVRFGLLSSVFDLLTFSVLLWVVRAPAAEFRTGWFVESLLTELLVALVVRTQRPSWRSRPSRPLAALTAAVVAAALVLPYTPIGAAEDLVPMPPKLLGTIVAITLAYVLSAEAFKRWFFREHALSKASPSPG
jgi:Mg2+-importing ATPase